MKVTIKKHLREHKQFYTGLGMGIGVAGITYIIVRGRYAALLSGTDSVRIDEKHTYWAHRPMKSTHTGHIGSYIFNSDINITNVVEREGRGHPGYMVRRLEDNVAWFSQKEAAIANGIHPNRMSDHLKGHTPHLNGFHYERLYPSAEK